MPAHSAPSGHFELHPCPSVSSAMEPLSALSIAAAVIQFVDFATKTCKEVNKMLDSHSLGALQEASFAKVAADLVGF